MSIIIILSSFLSVLFSSIPTTYHTSYFIVHTSYHYICTYMVSYTICDNHAVIIMTELWAIHLQFDRKSKLLNWHWLTDISDNSLNFSLVSIVSIFQFYRSILLFVVSPSTLSFVTLCLKLLLFIHKFIHKFIHTNERRNEMHTHSSLWHEPRAKSQHRISSSFMASKSVGKDYILPVFNGFSIDIEPRVLLFIIHCIAWACTWEFH